MDIYVHSEVNEIRLSMGQGIRPTIFLYPLPGITAVGTIFKVFSYDSVLGRNSKHLLPDIKRMNYVFSCPRLSSSFFYEMLASSNFLPLTLYQIWMLCYYLTWLSLYLCAWNQYLSLHLVFICKFLFASRLVQYAYEKIKVLFFTC